jgi:Na+/proline symporter
MVATTFAADTPLAVTELVGKNGISGNWLWWNFLIGGMLTTLFFSHLWRRAEVLTEVELLKIRYSGKKVNWLRGFKAVYLGLFMNSLIIAWVNLALMSIIEVFFNIHGPTLFLIMLATMLIAVLYSALSGLWGVAITDTIQFIIAMTGSIILAVIVVNSQQIGGIKGLEAQLPPQTFSFFPEIGAKQAAETLVISLGAFLAYGLVQWWASCYPGAEPGGGGYIAQRMMSTKNERHSIWATMLFQITHYAVRPWPWILVGLAALILYPNLDENNLRFGYVLAMKDFLPNGLKGLLLVAFLAAYMSTISTQLNFGASILTNDLYLLLKRKPLTNKQQVNAARIITLILMFVSLFFTSIITTISGVWQFILECGAGLGLVLILRWYWWRINAWSELAAMIAPFLGYSLAKFVFKWEFPNSYFFTVALTTIIWILVTFLTKPTELSVLQKFYSKVKPGGWWKPIEQTLGVQHKTIGINRFIGWFAAVIMGYGVLFAIGALILHLWKQLAIYLTMFIIGLIIMYLALKNEKF